MTVSTLPPETVWKATLGELEMQMTRATFTTWLQGTRALSFAGDEFVVGVRNDFAKDWLENRLYDLIARTLAGVAERPVTVRFVVWSEEIIAPQTAMVSRNGRAEVVATAPAEVAAGRRDEGARDSTENGLNRRYTFSNFIVGANNRLAYAAALSVAENPGQTYNPLFIYGGVGLGKTHLLHAIGHRCRQDGYRVRYISAETFTNDLVMAIRTKQTPEFRERYRTVDVLLIDDIQFISGKEGTQDEFFHTFDDLHSYGKQVIISSDRSPKSLAALEERLLSRFEWGLTADVQPPDEETRRAILLAKAEDLNCYVPDNVIEFIAHNSRQNIRELEGALNKVMAYANLTSRPIDLELVNMALADTMRRPERISVEQIIDIVCRYYNVTVDALISSSRKSTIAYPRQVAMYLARTETDASLPQIGAQMGPRDHTTVLHGSEKIKTLVDTDPQLRRDLLEIKAMLYERAAVITH
ncbi:MAG: chromosomal replication initiator protein DnaA [Anaerolineae bacterium]|nr:chromosomal replication initiator protein DnaA [Anaerolineae bacterium]